MMQQGHHGLTTEGLIAEDPSTELPEPSICEEMLMEIMVYMIIFDDVVQLNRFHAVVLNINCLLGSL